MRTKAKKSFNATNENIDWAKWTWNPVTGCKHGCIYCYARDIANRFYEQKFEPQLWEERLDAPEYTQIPEGRIGEPGIKNVFVVSMGDLLGEWVPAEWIEKVIESMKGSPKWNYILLTKNPKRYLEFDWPDGCLLGATADTQERTDNAMKVFSEIENRIRFLSCEPLMENIRLPDNPPIEWLIIGGRSKSSGMPEGQPEWKWVHDLIVQCDTYNLEYFMKPNLTVRSEQYPKRLR